MAKDNQNGDRILSGPWTPEDSSRLYGIPDWGKGFFGVSEAGHLTVLPNKSVDFSVDLRELVAGLEERGIQTPVLLRFSDLLGHRLKEVRTVFSQAIEQEQYEGSYTCIYPIKVNQQRHLCEEMRDFGREFGFGLEAGSKPELLAVLGLTAGQPDMPIVCNGFKDDEYIEIVTMAAKLGRNITVVVERFSELNLIFKHARRHGICPSIGLRIKLASRGAGRWQSSGGVRSKFGLFMSEVLRALTALEEAGLQDHLQMVHCHIGSQVNDIRRLSSAMNELGRVYAELKRLGAGLTTIDVGGGLGVDYDGSQTAWLASTNYSLEEYAREVVRRIKVACDEADLPHPHIYSESGRAMVAYSSVLVCNVIGSASLEGAAGRLTETVADEEVSQPVHELREVRGSLNRRNLLESYHKALESRDQAATLFSLGHLSLAQRAGSEELFWDICRALLQVADKDELPEELEPIQALLSDIYFCNFSLFQSVPDSWAIRQVFPICPIHRLDEKPDRIGVLADITCDSDGMVDRFVDKRDDKRTLELHEFRPGEPYLIGFFLVGAYQEILGDLHNLFGDTNAVHVSIDDQGDWSIDEVVWGHSVSEVLQYVQFDAETLRKQLRREVESVVKRGDLTVLEGRHLLRRYDEGLAGYTYLEEEEADDRAPLRAEASLEAGASQ